METRIRRMDVLSVTGQESDCIALRFIFIKI